MTKGRLEAFSDGVIAILITIMVIELNIARGAHGEAAHDYRALLGIGHQFFAYVLSFAYLGIYWNNHHHCRAPRRSDQARHAVWDAIHTGARVRAAQGS